MPWIEKEPPHFCDVPIQAADQRRNGDEWYCIECLSIWEVQQFTVSGKSPRLELVKTDRKFRKPPKSYPC